MFQYTLNGMYRPFGCAIIVGGTNPDSGKHELWMADPSGVCWRYRGVAIGKTRQAAKTEMEKVSLGDISCEQAVKECAKVSARLKTVRLIYRAYIKRRSKNFG